MDFHSKLVEYAGGALGMHLLDSGKDYTLSV